MLCFGCSFFTKVGGFLVFIICQKTVEFGTCFISSLLKFGIFRSYDRFILHVSVFFNPRHQIKYLSGFCKIHSRTESSQPLPYLQLRKIVGVFGIYQFRKYDLKGYFSVIISKYRKHGTLIMICGRAVEEVYLHQGCNEKVLIRRIGGQKRERGVNNLSLLHHRKLGTWEKGKRCESFIVPHNRPIPRNPIDLIIQKNQVPSDVKRISYPVTVMQVCCMLPKVNCNEYVT